MISEQTKREMAAGSANSGKFAAMPVRRPISQKSDHIIVPMFRPADGSGSQERMKIIPGQPGSIGNAKNLFSRRG